MIRLRAVRSLLLEEVAELRPAENDDALADLTRARLRAGLVAAFDWIAIVVLFALRPEGVPFLVLGRSEQALFTLGVLAVATHAGYRLGQMQKLGAVKRAWDSLPPDADSEEHV